MKLKLSEEKTLITNIRNKPAQFVGFNIKEVVGKSRKGWITRTRPNPERLKTKVNELHRRIKSLRWLRSNGDDSFRERMIHEINVINSSIRGIIQYYEIATWVHVDLQRYSRTLEWAAVKTLRKHGGFRSPANTVHNLPSVHSEYKVTIPAIRYRNMTVGITNLGFCKWKQPLYKNQDETPYTLAGRSKYQKRTGKKPLIVRADELLSESLSMVIGLQNNKPLYNFEYLLNRPYAFNRDKGLCRVCGELLLSSNVHTHHINPNLPMNLVNRVTNMASVHNYCHSMIHDGNDYEHKNTKAWKKIKDFRNKLR